MAASLIAGRSRMLRSAITICRKTTNSTEFSISSPPISSAFFFRRARGTSPLSASSRLPRELCSLLPFHCAIASACLVSKLPDSPNVCAECRFAHYLSPI
ncbi:hypothetical protein Ancab_007614 [Ancistrocladus abbreviatus]